MILYEQFKGFVSFDKLKMAGTLFESTKQFKQINFPTVIKAEALYFFLLNQHEVKGSVHSHEKATC